MDQLTPPAFPHAAGAVPPPFGAEPPLMARARRVGWGLIAMAAGAMMLGRAVPPQWRIWCSGVALACGVLGFLAIVNVALVRSLYRQIGVAKAQADAAGPPPVAPDAAGPNISELAQLPR